MDRKTYVITASMTQYSMEAAIRILRKEAYNKRNLAGHVRWNLGLVQRCTEASADLEMLASAIAGSDTLHCADCEQHLPPEAFDEQERICNSCERSGEIEDAEIRLRNAEEADHANEVLDPVTGHLRSE